MKKVKNEIKRAFRLPGNAAVMTMMAVILVCAAPALVSIVDSSMDENSISYDHAYEKEGSTASTINVDGVWSSLDSLIPSVNDGVWASVLTSDQMANGSYVFMKYDSSALRDGARHIEFTCNVSKVSLIFNSDVNPKSEHVLTADDDGVFRYTLDSLDSVRFKTGYFDCVLISVSGSHNVLPALLELELFVGKDYIIPYAEIIIGATGALLLVCAILATPWVSTSGLTVKRRR